MIHFKTPTHFYESLLPIFILSTILGVFPMFPVKKSGKYILDLSKKLQFITVGLLMIYTMCFIVTIIKRSNNVVGQKFYKKQNKVSNFGITFEFIFGVVILYTIYFMSFVKTKHVWKVIVDLNKVDEMMKNMNHKIKYGPTVCYQIIIIITGLLMVALIASMQIQNIRIEKFPPISLYMWILFIYPLIVLYDMNSQYGITAILIYQRFKMINKELEQIREELIQRKKLTTEFLSLTKPKTDSIILKNVKTLAKIHSILCKAANKTNLNYNIQMLPSLTHQFFISLFSVFYFYWMNSSKPFSSSCWLAWGFFKTYEILHVTIACHLATEEEEVVGRKIHKVLIKNRNYEIEEKLLIFSHQVTHSKFKFSLCGLFNIDAELLFNMIGSSTTFIVIMIQFQETMTPTVCVTDKQHYIF